MQFYRKNFMFFLVILIIFGVQNLEASTIQSPFDVDEDGWTLTGGDLSWSNSEETPGGFIEAKDSTNTNMYISAPSKFLGNLWEFENGTISFDATELENEAGTWDKFGVVTFTGGSVPISKDLALDPLPSVWWTHYSAILSADEWGVSNSEWKAILSNVTELTITLESGSSVGAETVGVDNIVVNSVPIPGAVWLLGTGIIGIVALRRRNRS